MCHISIIYGFFMFKGEKESMETNVSERTDIKRRYKINLEYEHCVMCGKEVQVSIDEDIHLRKHYIEGAGQLCEECYDKIYHNKSIKDAVLNEDYFKSEIEKYKHTVHYEDKVGYELFKRMIDIVFGVIAIIPSIVLIGIFSIFICLESEGSPIFSQIRVGKNGKLIKIHKLRSMRNDAEANGQKWAEEDDPRITKVGKFIRKHRIDELPQILDVLSGNMSLIGPRPEVPSLTKQFNDENPGFVTRLMVTPGLSGWAQINGGYYLSAREKWIKDNEYIEKRSVGMYFKIFYLTIKTVLIGDGAR